MATKNTNVFKEFNDNLAKAFRDASARFNQQFEKGLEAQRQAIKNALKMAPNLEAFNRQLTAAFQASGERFRKGLEQALNVQREAMRKAAPQIKKGFDELPIARLSQRFREAAIEALGTQQRAFAASARELATAFEKLASESLSAIGEASKRAFKEFQNEDDAAGKRPRRKSKAGKKR